MSSLPNIDDVGKLLTRLHLNSESDTPTKLDAAAISEYVLSCCTIVNNTAFGELLIQNCEVSHIAEMKSLEFSREVMKNVVL